MRAAAAGGIAAGAGDGIAGECGTARGGTTFGAMGGGVGFASEGGTCVAGPAGLGSAGWDSEGAAGAGGLCGDAITGDAAGMTGAVTVIGGTGAAGVGTTGFCSTANSGFFSVTGIGGVGCSVLGGDTSTRGERTTGRGICRCGKDRGTGTGWRASGLDALSIAGVAGGAVAASLAWSSPTARWSLVNCFAFSSVSSFSCLRSLACRTKREMVRTGVASSTNP